MIRGWQHLQQTSKAALVALVAVLLVTVGIELSGNDGPAVGVLAGFVVAAAVLVVWTERSAGGGDGDA